MSPLGFVGAPTPTPSATLNINDIAAQYGMGPAASAGATARVQAGSSDDPQILWDFGSEHLALDRRGPRNIGIKKARSELLNQFDKMDAITQRQMAGFLTLAGYLSQASDKTFADMDIRALLTPLPDVRKAYAQLLDDAYQAQASPYNQQITPMQLLKQQIAYRMGSAGIPWKGNLDNLGKLTGMSILGGASAEAGAAGGSSSGSGKPEPKAGSKKSVTQSSTSVSLINPEDADALTRSALQEQLGRDPSEHEYEDFLSMLHAAQRKNPDHTSTTSTYTYDPNFGYQQTASSSTTTQGIGAAGLQQLAYEKATQNPDWAEWQAMGIYAPALFEALGSTIPGI